jgi:hypothetical protein
MDDVNKTGGYWEQKEVATDRAVCRTGFGIGYGLVVSQATERINRFAGLSKGLNLHILYCTSPQSVTENL